MVAKELLDILACPETKQSLKVADDALIARFNEAIEAGTLEKRSGEKVDSKLDGGLVREDGTVLYPILDDIPILLIEEAIPIPAN